LAIIVKCCWTKTYLPEETNPHANSGHVSSIKSHCTKLDWLLYSDWFTSYLIRALIPYHSHSLLLLNHVVIVVKLCCVEGLIEDRCISNKHSRY